MKKMLIMLLVLIVASVSFVSAGTISYGGQCKQDMNYVKNMYNANMNNIKYPPYPAEKCRPLQPCDKLNKYDTGDKKSCDKCGKNECSEGYCDTYMTTCCIYDYCSKCGEKHYLDGRCDKCGDKCSVYMHCPYCEKDYVYKGDLSCPQCGKDTYYVEHCDKCSYTHSYNGYCDKCRAETRIDKSCHTVGKDGSYTNSDNYMEPNGSDYTSQEQTDN